MASRVLLVPIASTSAFSRRAFAGILSAANELPDVDVAVRLPDLSWPDAIREFGASGAIIEPDTVDTLAEILATGVPCVSYSNHRFIRERIDVVLNDDQAIGHLVAEHLLAMGHRHFAVFISEDRLDYFADRIAGFVDTIKAAGHPVAIGPPPPVASPTSKASNRWDVNAADWLAKQPKPLGVFAPYDYYGFILRGVCRQLGRQVPSDVAIVGVDDDELYCFIGSPQLSSVATAAYEIGRRCLHRLHQRVCGQASPTAIQRVPPIGLVVRGSSSAEAVDDPDVASAIKYIRDNLTRPLTVDDVVRHVAISRRSLERRFASCVRRTISSQIALVRVEHAKRLLVDTDLPLAEVSRRCGLGPQPRLHLMFKRTTGYTPGAYRAAFRRTS